MTLYAKCDAYQISVAFGECKYIWLIRLPTVTTISVCSDIRSMFTRERVSDMNYNGRLCSDMWKRAYLWIFFACISVVCIHWLVPNHSQFFLSIVQFRYNLARKKNAHRAELPFYSHNSARFALGLIQFAYAFHFVETYRAHFMMQLHYYYDFFFTSTPERSTVTIIVRCNVIHNIHN